MLFWRYLIWAEAATSNPAATAFGIREPKPLPEHLRPEEQDEVLAALALREERRPRPRDAHRRTHEAAGLRDFALVATFLLTGLRVSEAAKLELNDLNLRALTLRVVQGKGAKDRLVPVIQWLRDVLVRYVNEARPQLVQARSSSTDFVTTRGRPFSERGLWYLVARVVSPIVGRHVHPHALRHSFASRALAGGADVVTIQVAMGHECIETTRRYLHISNAAYHANLSRSVTTGWLKDPPGRPAGNGGGAPPPSHPSQDRQVRERLRMQRRARPGRPRQRGGGA